jgi:hypothetical protein
VRSLYSDMVRFSLCENYSGIWTVFIVRDGCILIWTGLIV